MRDSLLPSLVRLTRHRVPVSVSELSARGKPPSSLRLALTFQRGRELASHKLWSSSLFLHPGLKDHLSHVCREHEMVMAPEEAPACVNLQ